MVGRRGDWRVRGGLMMVDDELGGFQNNVKFDTKLVYFEAGETRAR